MDVNMESDSIEESKNWIPTSFNTNPTEEETFETSSAPASSVDTIAIAVPEPVEPPSDDLSFDAISRQKLEMVELASPKGPLPGMSMFEDDTRSSWSGEPPKPTAETDAQFKDDIFDEDLHKDTTSIESEKTIASDLEQSKEALVLEKDSLNDTSQEIIDKTECNDAELQEISMFDDTSQNSASFKTPEKQTISDAEEPKNIGISDEDSQSNANQNLIENSTCDNVESKEPMEVNEESEIVKNQTKVENLVPDEQSKEAIDLNEDSQNNLISKKPIAFDNANIQEAMTFDEESQNSASEKMPQTPCSFDNGGLKEGKLFNEDSQNSTDQKVLEKSMCSEDEESKEVLASFPPEKLFEYMWPQENGEFYLLQEQICDYLNIKSFKRKYPKLVRRSVEKDEKRFLKERGIVTEMQCDLGLTALKSEEVLELMSKDYPDQYAVYIRILREKEQQKNREAAAANHSEKVKMVDLVKKAMKSAAEYNAHLNQERREERKSCMDLQTFTVQYPAKKVVVKTDTKPGKYPVALLPGQFQDYYKKYSSDEIKYLPINTVLYGPLKELNTVTASQSDGSQSDSDDSTASDGSGSSTHDDSSSESEKNGETTQENKDSTDPLYKPKVKPNAVCKVCKKGPEGEGKELVHCADCDNSAHPLCIELTNDVVDVLKTYAWQCMDCKVCSHCNDPNNEDKMLFCDICDRGYHTFCVGLRSLPRGKWVCQQCGTCSVCGTDKPGESSKAQWQYEVETDASCRPKIMCQACFRKKR